MNKSLREVAKELNISCGYLSEILNGKKGCNEELMNKLLEYYPNLKFYIFTEPRYKVSKIFTELYGKQIS